MPSPRRSRERGRARRGSAACSSGTSSRTGGTATTRSSAPPVRRSGGAEVAVPRSERPALGYLYGREKEHLMSKIAWIALGLLAWTSSQASKWTDISAPVLKQLADDGKKLDWPQGSAGVTVDPATGDVFMVVPGQGLW